MRRPHYGAAFVVEVAVCVVMATPGFAARLGVPIPSARAERVRWSVPPTAAPTALAVRLRAARDRADSLAAWAGALRDTVLRPYALRRVAMFQLAARDSAGADGSWAALARERSIWQWEAVRARSDLAAARGDMARADSLLDVENRVWPESDRAQSLSRRIELKLALRDTSAAMTFAWQMVRAFPADPRAEWALGIYETLFTVRGGSLSAGDLWSGAEVYRLRGRLGSAVDWLERGEAIEPSRFVPVQRAGLLRRMRRFREAQMATSAALRTAKTAEDSALALAERSRIHADAGEASAALRDLTEAWRLVARRSTWPLVLRARLFEERGEWKSARDDYALVATTGDTSSSERPQRQREAFRAGLMSLAAGEPDEALRWFSRDESEASRFWSGVVLRRTAWARGDSLLLTLARTPGYTFYRSAARDTLGVTGWRGSPAPQPMVSSDYGIRLASALDGLGSPEDAAFVMDRWSAYDPRVFRGPRRADAFLDAAAASYLVGRPRQAVRFGERAVALVISEPDSLRWSISPWLYPPAYDSLFAAWPESAAAGKIDRALLQAVAWKESHFDPRARSRSDALGLLQLKRQAVTDVAGWLREQAPSDSALADPALNLRYGAEYLQRLLTRFGGDLPRALAAYNAGPTAAKRWTRLRALGGDALACEEIDFPETQDYVKTILAVRQAYRELRPTLAP